MRTKAPSSPVPLFLQQLPIVLQTLLLSPIHIRLQPPPHPFIPPGHDPRSRQSRISRIVDSNSKHGTTPRHTRATDQAIPSVADAWLDGQSDDGDRFRERGDHAGEMGGAPGGRDDDFDVVAGRGGAGVSGHGRGCAVGGRDALFEGDGEFGEDVVAVFEVGLVGYGTGGYADDWFGSRLWCSGSGGGSSSGRRTLFKQRLFSRWVVMESICDRHEMTHFSFQFFHAVAHESQMPHLSPFRGLSLAVEMDSGAGSICGVCETEIRIWISPTKDVKHDGWIQQLETLGGYRAIENCKEVGVIL